MPPRLSLPRSHLPRVLLQRLLLPQCDETLHSRTARPRKRSHRNSSGKMCWFLWNHYATVLHVCHVSVLEMAKCSLDTTHACSYIRSQFVPHTRRCACCASCCLSLCAPDSDGAQECSGEMGRASRACFSIARTLWRGIMSTKVIAMGCMYAQQYHELETVEPAPPKNKEMER